MVMVLSTTSPFWFLHSQLQ